MSSEDIFQKIIKRNKYVMNCGTARNYAYSVYLKAALDYDSTKKAFYTALQLARLDGNIQEDKLQRYEHLVKHFDKQLLNQLKDRYYDVLKFSLENENKEEDDFNNRMAKIKNGGYLRNRFHFEFVDSKSDFEKAKELFYNETALALRDGLITDIDEKLHIESIKNIEIELDKEMATSRHDFTKKRKGQDYRDNSGRGHGRNHVHGRGDGRARNVRGRERNGMIIKQSFKGGRKDW